ncbi:hypothetical protein [Pseudolysinimonas sp.]|uniref:hypothetical protein n=1 Tax=Pseudolysinimonas sp. TaxID=2680009 RepID=UPI003F7F0265
MAQTTKVKQIFADIESTREVWKLPAATPGHTIVAVNGRVGVTIAGTPGQVQSIALGTTGFQISGIPLPDNGQAPLHSTVHTTGTFEGPVTGGQSTTAQNTPVYLVIADGTLTLTADGNNTVKAGVVNFPEGYRQSGTVLPFKIGV